MTALSFGPDVTVINSFSKYYCMTGWRIGWMVLPETLVRPVERIAQSLYISPPEISQVAAIEAFGATEELEAVKARYAWNRELLMRRPAGARLRARRPDGRSVLRILRCVEADQRQHGLRAAACSAEAHVAATPGRDFDPLAGHRYMRFSYAGSHDDMVAGDGPDRALAADSKQRLGARRSVLARLDQIGVDLGLAEPFHGFQPVQALRPGYGACRHGELLDRRLQPVLDDVFRKRPDRLGMKRLPARRRHVDAFDRNSITRSMLPSPTLQLW